MSPTYHRNWDFESTSTPCGFHGTLPTRLRGPKVRSNTLTLYATRSTCVRGMDGSKIMEKYGKLHTSQTFNLGP